MHEGLVFAIPGLKIQTWGTHRSMVRSGPPAIATVPLPTA